MLPTNWPEHLFTGNACSWIKNTALNYCKGKGIDVGAGQWPLPGAIPIDLHSELTVDDFGKEQLDFVFSSHCLEHIDDWGAALVKWTWLIKKGGILFLYLPHEESPWRNCKKHKWQPTPELIADYLTRLGFDIIESTSRPDNYCSFHFAARKKENNAPITN